MDGNKSSLGSLLLWVGALVGGAFVIALLFATWQGQKAPAQPLAFNHQVHVEQVGLSCLYCHSNAQRGVSAGIPSLTKCMACHNSIEPKSKALKQLQAYAEKGEPIEWVPVAIQPDFVYFSHQPHVNAGLACETCHGEVGQTDIPQSYLDKQNMGWCLSCHKNNAVDEEHFLKLTDCSTCHK